MLRYASPRRWNHCSSKNLRFVEHGDEVLPFLGAMNDPITQVLGKHIPFNHPYHQSFNRDLPSAISIQCYSVWIIAQISHICEPILNSLKTWISPVLWHGSGIVTRNFFRLGQETQTDTSNTTWLPSVLQSECGDRISSLNVAPSAPGTVTRCVSELDVNTM